MASGERFEKALTTMSPSAVKGKGLAGVLAKALLFMGVRGFFKPIGSIAMSKSKQSACGLCPCSRCRSKGAALDVVGS